MITIDELKEKIEQLGYVATEELLYDTFNALCMFSDGKISVGQDIFAICLEGPPGAGKTEFAKVYTKVCNELFNGNVEMVDYQCDATTGKTELFEDINISAAIRGDADHVNIPGKLVEAINKVNSGKKVVLFIDEYDKAREETDAFLLQFLQSGKINSTQHGDLEIKEESKSNLQVILCKNDMREELSGPLSRRIRIIRLDYMKPEIFYQVAYRNLVENRQDKVNDGLLNLVVLMYQQAYDSKEIYNRIPSCSEMLIAILDADRLLKRANAPQYIVYNTIVRNMFKSIDDIKTFEQSLNKSKDESNKLSDLIKSMKTPEEQESTTDLNSLIAQKVFTNEGTKLSEKTIEMQRLIDEYKVKFAQMEANRKRVIEDEIKKILLENGKLVSTNKMPNVIRNFEDESAHVKRGYDIFKLSDNNWIDIADIQIPNLSHHLFIEKLVQYASQLGIKIYENGVLLKEDGELRLIVINDLDDTGLPRYRIMANFPVIPSTYLSSIESFISFALDVYNLQTKTPQQITGEVTDIKKGKYSLNSLIYNDHNLDFETVKENVYNISTDSDVEDLSLFKNIKGSLSCSNMNNALEVSKEIMSGKGKVKTYE